jgi:hypothetical protein
MKSNPRHSHKFLQKKDKTAKLLFPPLHKTRISGAPALNAQLQVDN